MDTTLDLAASKASAETAAASTCIDSREAFDRALGPLIDRLFRFALVRTGDTAQAEDLLQAALIRAYLHRGSFRGQGTLLGWLFQIIRHEHAEQARRAARRRSLMVAVQERFQPWLEDWWEQEHSPEEELEAQVASHVLLACIQALPEAYRSVIHLCDMEEMSIEEVAAVLNIPQGTVKSRHARGRARLATLVRAKLEREP